MSNIAILTDFGTKDYYCGVMKGVILSINPQVVITDLNNNIPPGNIKKAAYQLFSAYQYFPKKTIFVCVVDPGVGTVRKPLLLVTNQYYFIGPDNGIFSYINQIENPVAIELNNSDFWLKNTSSTFHGRDIFAPVAAQLSLDYQFQRFGKILNIQELVCFAKEPPKVFANHCEGNILDIDHFGNIITNIPTSIIADRLIKMVQIKEQKIRNISRTYGQVQSNEFLALIGSSGFLEISVNGGNASNLIGIFGTEKVFVSW